MTFLNIRANQGITQAIAEKLKLTQKFSADTWNQVVGLVESESKQKNIFDESKGKDIDSKDYHSNYVINEGKVEISDNTWNRICRILGKEKECVEVKQGQQQDTSPSVTQANNLAKAFNLITRGLRDGKLQGTPEGFRSAIVQAYGNVDTSEGKTPTVAEYVVSLLTDAQKIMGKTDNVSKEMVQRAIGGAVELCPDGELYGKKCSEYSDPKVVEQFMKDNNIPDTIRIQQQDPVQEMSNVQGIDPPEVVEANIEKAQKFIKDNLSNLTDAELKQIGLTPAKRDRILGYIQHIKYDNTHDSGQAIGTEIFISYKCKDTKNLASMINLLMHEANHCDEEYLNEHPEVSEQNDLRHRDENGNVVHYGNMMNTKEEERACETLGVMTTALFMKKGLLPGYETYGRYGQQYNSGNPIPYTQYLEKPELLDRDITNWVSGYTNYPETLEGDITVEHMRHPDKIRDVSAEERDKKLSIQKGDIIKIGDKEYTIGRGKGNVILSPVDSAPIFQIDGICNNIIFDKIKPTSDEISLVEERCGKKGCIKTEGNCIPVEIKRNGKTIYTGKMYR